MSPNLYNASTPYIHEDTKSCVAREPCSSNWFIECEACGHTMDQVLANLSSKRVRDEKALEFKKQVVSNKSLKEYFKNNPTEKLVLQNDI